MADDEDVTLPRAVLFEVAVPETETVELMDNVMVAFGSSELVVTTPKAELDEDTVELNTVAV